MHGCVCLCDTPIVAPQHVLMLDVRQYLTYKTGCSPLHHLQLVLLILSIWVPHSVEVFKDGSDVCGVGLLFYFDEV